MRNVVKGSAPTCELVNPDAKPSRALFAVALLATGGLAGPVFAADPGGNGPGALVAQAGSQTSTASPSAQAAPQQALSPIAGPGNDGGSAPTYADPSAGPNNSGSGTLVAQASQSGAGVSPSAQTGPVQAAPPVAGSGSGGGAISTYTNPPPPTQAQNPFAMDDKLKLRGWIVPVPGAANTVDQGLFGLRDALAEDGISYIGFAEATFQDNVLRHGLPAGNQFGPHSRDLQLYNGQLPSYTDIAALFINYDLQRYGIPDGQITVAGDIVGTNWQPGGPNGIGVAEAVYYQTMFNRLLEVKAGYISNATEFLGTQVGGNLAAGVFGVSAAIGPENGENVPTFSTPGVDVKLNLPDHFYTKVGVQRGLDPLGVEAERLENPSEVRFEVPGAGAFLIDETGYRVFASPGHLGTWIRAAANYTTTEYSDLTAPRKGTNYGLYFLADRQLIQPAPYAAPGSAIGGIYAGFSVMYGPPNVDVFTQYYEARLYGFGVIPHRPFDVVSMVWNKNVFSGYAVRETRSFGVLAHNTADTATIAYSAHVSAGVSLNLGVSFVDHPTVISYDQHTGSDFNVLANLFIWL